MIWSFASSPCESHGSGPGTAAPPGPGRGRRRRRWNRLAQGAEGAPHFGGEQVGLFPGGEVAALGEPVVVDEVVRVGGLGPAAGGLVELVGEDADGERDRD